MHQSIQFLRCSRLTETPIGTRNSILGFNKHTLYIYKAREKHIPALILTGNLLLQSTIKQTWLWVKKISITYPQNMEERITLSQQPHFNSKILIWYYYHQSKLKIYSLAYTSLNFVRMMKVRSIDKNINQKLHNLIENL